MREGCVKAVGAPVVVGIGGGGRAGGTMQDDCGLEVFEPGEISVERAVEVRGEG